MRDTVSQLQVRGDVVTDLHAVPDQATGTDPLGDELASLPKLLAVDQRLESAGLGHLFEDRMLFRGDLFEVIGPEVVFFVGFGKILKMIGLGIVGDVGPGSKRLFAGALSEQLEPAGLVVHGVTDLMGESA